MGTADALEIAQLACGSVPEGVVRASGLGD
jgi:hypothetical protein